MLAKETAVAAEHLHFPIGQNKPFRHFPAPFGRIDQQGANAAVDIYLAVRKRGARQEGQFIKRFAMCLEMQRKRFEHSRAIVKIHGTQRCPPVGFGVAAHRSHIWHRAQNAEGLTGHRRTNLPPTAI